MLNSESVITIILLARDSRTKRLSADVSPCGYSVTRVPLRLANAHPSTMDAWLSASENISHVASSHNAGMTPQFAAYPEENRMHSSVPLSEARARSSLEWPGVYPQTSALDRGPEPCARAARAAAMRTALCVDMPR